MTVFGAINIGSIRAPGLEALEPPIWLPHVLVTLLLVPRNGVGYVRQCLKDVRSPHAVELSIKKLHKAPDKHPFNLP